MSVKYSCISSKENIAHGLIFRISASIVSNWWRWACMCQRPGPGLCPCFVDQQVRTRAPTSWSACTRSAPRFTSAQAMSLFHQSTVHGSLGHIVAELPPPSQPRLSSRTLPSGSRMACGAARSQKSFEKSSLKVPSSFFPTCTFQWCPPGHGQKCPPAAFTQPIISANFSSSG